MNQIFFLKYSVGDSAFEIPIQARDWHEAESILIAIKETGVISGKKCGGSVITLEVAYHDMRPGDSLREH